LPLIALREQSNNIKDMAKFALITKLGTEDKGIPINTSNYQMQADLKFLIARNASEVKFDLFFQELKRLKLRPCEIAMDLLIIACTMYAADIRIDRKKFADDSWTREIDLFIPVSNPSIWETQKERLKEIFRFLTGDIWEIHFRARVNQTSITPTSNRVKGMTYSTNTVCLFSGGMDSFIGAIDLLSTGVQPLFLGHAKSADVSPNQKFCEAALRQAFPQISLRRIYAFLRIPKRNLFDTEEKTERGRSFLFLTLGGICASALSPQSKLIVPENGLISLNLPLTPLRVGSHSTRTTHPYYMSLMQELFNNLQLGVAITNPYQFKTKGEMLVECANSSLVTSTKTMSCSHPAGRHGEGTKHCGYCVPCLIRQAAFLKANMTDIQGYKEDIQNGAALLSGIKKDNIIGFKYLIEKVSTNPNYLKTLIRSTGPLGNDVDEYVNTYRRGLDEVVTLLSNVTI
jgi:hypothetical protein